jgi:hypothetical protein
MATSTLYLSTADEEKARHLQRFVMSETSGTACIERLGQQYLVAISGCTSIDREIVRSKFHD